jgi:hypothetical protein
MPLAWRDHAGTRGSRVEDRNFKRYFATVPSGMHPLGWGGHRTPPQPLAGRLAVRPAGSTPAAWLVLLRTPARGAGQQTPAARSGGATMNERLVQTSGQRESATERLPDENKPGQDIRALARF